MHDKADDISSLPNDQGQRRYYKRMELWLVAKSGKIEELEMQLRRGVDLNEKDPERRTALWWATSRGHAKIVEFLLSEEGLDINHPDAKAHLTPLHTAVLHGYDVLNLFLQHRDIEINTQDDRDDEISTQAYATKMAKRQSNMLYDTETKS